MSKPEADPSSGISSGDALIWPERQPACRRPKARPGFGTERENLTGDAKGKGTNGANREAESTDAPERGGLPRSSDEAGHERWLRVIINLAVGALEPRGHEDEAAKRTATPVLLLLEEFPVLKHMEKLEIAAGQLAGSGVKLWVIVQNLGQLERHYKVGWETFIANTGAITSFANMDMKTLGYISGKLGKVPMLLTRSSNASSSALLGGARPTQEDLRDASLLETDELSRTFERGKRRVLVQAAGQRPLILERVLYYEDRMFGGMFDSEGLDAQRIMWRYKADAARRGHFQDRSAWLPWQNSSNAWSPLHQPKKETR